MHVLQERQATAGNIRRLCGSASDWVVIIQINKDEEQYE